MTGRLNAMTKAHELGKILEWDKWREEIPYIKWPSTWLVKAIPPTVGAVIRYLVTLPNKEGRVSIFLDCYGILGCEDKPYWEVYPYKDDVVRCDMENTTDLLFYIEQALADLEDKR